MKLTLLAALLVGAVVANVDASSLGFAPYGPTAAVGKIAGSAAASQGAAFNGHAAASEAALQSQAAKIAQAQYAAQEASAKQKASAFGEQEASVSAKQQLVSLMSAPLVARIRLSDFPNLLERSL